MLEEKTILEQIEMNADGVIFAQLALVIVKDGEELVRKNHRVAFAPGDDLSASPAEVVKLAELFWTPEFIQAYKDKVNLPIAQ